MIPKILSVDDSKAVRTLLSKVFSPFACELSEATNGEEGFVMAARERPDLVVRDYNMPVMDVVSMLELLRDHVAIRHIPVIMRTTDSSAEEIATIARLAVNDYLIFFFKQKTAYEIGQ